MENDLIKPKKPIGDFILGNAKGTQTENGVYYHYSEVCSLLNKYEKLLTNTKDLKGLIEGNTELFTMHNVKEAEKVLSEFVLWLKEGNTIPQCNCEYETFEDGSVVRVFECKNHEIKN